MNIRLDVLKLELLTDRQRDGKTGLHVTKKKAQDLH
jgi:hypothetical protein